MFLRWKCLFYNLAGWFRGCLWRWLCARLLYAGYISRCGLFTVGLGCHIFSQSIWKQLLGHVRLMACQTSHFYFYANFTRSHSRTNIVIIWFGYITIYLTGMTHFRCRLWICYLFGCWIGICFQLIFALLNNEEISRYFFNLDFHILFIFLLGSRGITVNLSEST